MPAFSQQRLLSDDDDDADALKTGERDYQVLQERTRKERKDRALDDDDAGALISGERDYQVL